MCVCVCVVEIMSKFLVLLNFECEAGRPYIRTYIQQLCEDTGCSQEDLPDAMNDKEKVAREGQGYRCYQHDIMMMMMMNIHHIINCNAHKGY